MNLHPLEEFKFTMLAASDVRIGFFMNKFRHSVMEINAACQQSADCLSTPRFPLFPTSQVFILTAHQPSWLGEDYRLTEERRYRQIKAASVYTRLGE